MHRAVRPLARTSPAIESTDWRNRQKEGKKRREEEEEEGGNRWPRDEVERHARAGGREEEEEERAEGERTNERTNAPLAFSSLIHRTISVVEKTPTRRHHHVRAPLGQEDHQQRRLEVAADAVPHAQHVSYSSACLLYGRARNFQ